MSVVTPDTASRLLRAYREIEAAKGLRDELMQNAQRLIDPRSDVEENRTWKSGLWRTGIEMTIRTSSSSGRIVQVQPDLALRVIDAHLAAMEIELIAASAQARHDLAGVTTTTEAVAAGEP